MKIIIPGTESPDHRNYRFKCTHCDCVWDAEYNEGAAYRLNAELKNPLGSTVMWNHSLWVSQCPTCKRAAIYCPNEFMELMMKTIREIAEKDNIDCLKS